MQQIIVDALLCVGPEEGSVVCADVLQRQLKVPKSGRCTGRRLCWDVAGVAVVMCVLAIASMLAGIAALCGSLLHVDAADQCGRIARRKWQFWVR